jgi:ketol-acid reductoisomerase
VIESLFRRYTAQGLTDERAFVASAESITGPISRAISRQGLRGLHAEMSPSEAAEFERAYAASYRPAFEVLIECYEEVATGNEIRSVILAGKRLPRFPMGRIDGARTWVAGDRVRASRSADAVAIHPFTAGVYCAVMMAQIDLLLEKGHHLSEIVNESVIEAVDSLNPYMHHKGVAFMVDNCSTTARLGARKWAPRFDYILEQQAYPAADGGELLDAGLMDSFRNHPIHEAISICARFRPSMDINFLDA